MIAQLQNIGTTINSTIPFTDEVMNNLLSFGGLIKSNTSLITTELVNNISDMINNQLKLIIPQDNLLTSASSSENFPVSYLLYNLKQSCLYF